MFAPADFITEQGELVKPEYSNAGKLVLGCYLKRENGSSITGRITCERIGRAYWANEEGWVIQEFWIQHYQQLNGNTLKILQANQQKPQVGDLLLAPNELVAGEDVYLKWKKGLLQMRTNAAGRIEQLTDSNDSSDQYALVVFFIIIVVFLSISGFFKFKH